MNSGAGGQAGFRGGGAGGQAAGPGDAFGEQGSFPVIGVGGNNPNQHQARVPSNGRGRVGGGNRGWGRGRFRGGIRHGNTDSAGTVSNVICFRCKGKGHGIANCKAILMCNICEGDNHLANKCLLSLMPRPIANLYGFGADGLGFYHISTSGSKKLKKENNKMGLIRIIDDQLSKDFLIAELRRLIPMNWQPQVEMQGDNAFLVHFPTRLDMPRMAVIGDVHVKEHKVVMQFEEWNLKPTPKYQLQKVWVHVLGVSFEVHDFLSLCAIGSIIGTAMRVDTEKVRKNDFVRMLVGVLDIEAIPSSVEIVVGEYVYDMFFKVEVAEVAVVDENIYQREDHEGEDNSGRVKDAEMEDRDSKRFKNNSDVKSSAPKSREGQSTSINKGNTLGILASNTAVKDGLVAAKYSPIEQIFDSIVEVLSGVVITPKAAEVMSGVVISPKAAVG